MATATSMLVASESRWVVVRAMTMPRAAESENPTAQEMAILADCLSVPATQRRLVTGYQRERSLDTGPASLARQPL